MELKNRFQRSGLKTYLMISIFFLLLILPGTPAEGNATSELEKKITREEHTMSRLEKQVKEHEKAISKVKREEKGVLNELSTYDQKKSLAEQKIKVLQLKQENVSASIKELRHQIEETDRELLSMKEIYQDRIVSIYKYGGNAGLKLLLSAPSAHEALDTSYLLSRIARQDQEIIESVHVKKRELLDASASLREKQILLQSQADDLAAAKNTYEKEKDKRNSLLGRLRKEKSLHLKAAKELERSQKEISNKIFLLTKKKTDLEKSQQGSSVAKKSSVVTYMRPGAKLAWPVRGKITSKFGTRVHPVFKTRSQHTGIDIDASEGDPVKSAQNGEVLFAGWLRGYGQIIILDHGNNLTTVYAHLSYTRVTEGRGVRQGEVIGNVGSTGVATGAHLHFEVRVNGEARDPMRYL